MGSLIVRLDKEFNLEQTIGAGVSGSSKGVIPKELGWTEYSNSLAVASGLLHLCPDVKTIVRIDGQSAMVTELEDGLRRRLEVKSNLLCAGRYGKISGATGLQDWRQHEGLRQPGLRMPGTPPQEIGYESLEV